MKKTLLFSVALAGLMLGSCSSSDDLNGGETGKFGADGQGFVNVTLNLPTQPQSTSRAANDVLDHVMQKSTMLRMPLLSFLREQMKQQQQLRLLII